MFRLSRRSALPREAIPSRRLHDPADSPFRSSSALALGKHSYRQARLPRVRFNHDNHDLLGPPRQWLRKSSITTSRFAEKLKSIELHIAARFTPQYGIDRASASFMPCDIGRIERI